MAFFRKNTISTPNTCTIFVILIVEHINIHMVLLLYDYTCYAVIKFKRIHSCKVKHFILTEFKIIDKAE